MRPQDSSHLASLHAASAIYGCWERVRYGVATGRAEHMERVEYAFLPIRKLADMLRRGEATPVDLVEYFVKRLETIGRRLNAVVTIDRDGALREAHFALEELRAGRDRGPLHGIPYGVKDLVATVGTPTSWGAGPLRDQQFDEDATIVKRLRDAGAILVSKLALVELAGGFYNQPNASFTGPGINPWNVDAWSGGSSSGSGSAVGAGCVPFAIGSDTLGSIITPSSYCGIAGLRPSYGRISRHGAMALSWTLDKLGPMCLTADDCGLVLEAIAGPDIGDPTTLPSSFRHTPSPPPALGFRLGVVREGLEAAQPEVRRNFEASLSVLSEFGALEDIELPDLPYIQTGQIIIAAEAAAALESLIDNGVIAHLTALEDRLGIFAGTQIPAIDYLRAMRVRRSIRTQINSLFRRYDGIVSPTSLQVASPLTVSFDEYRGKARWSQLSAACSLSGIPAVTVPNGFGERELPTGLQIIGSTETERTILAVAHTYQQRTSWHVMHPND